MRRFFLLFYLITSLAMTQFALASTSANKRVGGPYYFGSVDILKKLPAKVSHPLTETEAKRRIDSAYYEAFYNDDGRLLSLQKHLNGQRDWRHEYTYTAAGKLTSYVETYDGKSVEYKVDEIGKSHRQPPKKS